MVDATKILIDHKADVNIADDVSKAEGRVCMCVLGGENASVAFL